MGKTMLGKGRVFVSILLVSLLFTEAKAVSFDEPIFVSVKLNKPKGLQASQIPATKPIVLMNIQLTSKQKQNLLRYKEASYGPRLIQSTSNLPVKKDLGMNNVPVLDQGHHGSCVTFANTAAIDALLGQGDYISQLCHLELGRYLQQRSYTPSGWDGTWGTLVLNQIERFGIISKANQRDHSCAGVREYPSNEHTNTGNPMSLDEFKMLSENLNEKLYWHSLLSFSQRFEWGENASSEAEHVLQEVKKTIVNKPANTDVRITFGALLPVSYCNVGACARFHADGDTWVLTNAIKQDANPNFGGHEMIITGYDDTAVAIDNEGQEHRGLLIIRNSWGEHAGDQGTFYMSYDFFKQFVIEVQKIAKEA